ncbi:MAG TPA: heme-binding domain-containing protein [Candidatus Binataceae bacterium]
MHRRAKKLLVAGLSGLAVMLLIAQLKAVEHTNPSSNHDVDAPPQVQLILRRACYDCHSNETRWPWYSRFAPVSSLVVHDVEIGRKEINFSEWGSYYPAVRTRKLQWMERSLHKEAMPPWRYRLMHPGARLTDADRAVLEKWIESEIAQRNTKPGRAD